MLVDRAVVSTDSAFLFPCKMGPDAKHVPFGVFRSGIQSSQIGGQKTHGNVALRAFRLHHIHVAPIEALPHLDHATPEIDMLPLHAQDL